MPVIKKIVLHPLERLDLVDVNGLQDLMFKNVADAVGSVSGGVSGLTRVWEAVSINNSTDLISFSDFQFQGGIAQADTQQLWSTYVGTFDASSDTNGTCSFDAVKTLVQNYVNANGTLPPTPLSETFNNTDHRQYYPYIWARSVYGDSIQANRRFWSVADAQENTSLVNTRVVEGVNFSVGVTPPAVVSGNLWTLIGRIYSWVNTAGTVTLSANGVVPFMLADSMLNNSSADSWTKIVDEDNNIDTDFNFRNVGGTAMAFRYLKALLDQVINEGANDEAPTQDFQTAVYKKPFYSIAGLSKKVTDLQGAFTEYQGNVFFRWDYRSLFLVQPVSDRLKMQAVLSSNDINVLADYTKLAAGYTNLIASVPAPFYPANDNQYTQAQIRLALANFVVLVPQTEEGKKFSISFTPIVDEGVMVIQGNVASATETAKASQHMEGMDIVIEDGTNSGNRSNANTIKALTYTDVDGTVQNGYGIKLRRSNWYTNPQVTATNGRYFTTFNFTLKIFN